MKYYIAVGEKDIGTDELVLLTSDYESVWDSEDSGLVCDKLAGDLFSIWLEIWSFPRELRWSVADSHIIALGGRDYDSVYFFVEV